MHKLLAMMRELLIAASLAACMIGVAGTAQATDQNINISATVASFCKIQSSLIPADDTLDWTSLITTGFITGTATTKTYAVVCNKDTTVTLIAVNGGLITSSAAAAGFDNIINYTASASTFVTIAAGSTATVATASAGANETLGSANRGTPGAANISVTITPIVNSNPLVAGTYNDTLTLRIVPN
ncbi:MAG: hypothetical protein HC869_14065 [Rhodospirillales bacterium]|nr:hypothetical protein [Rhodospirillales bacterium]